MSALSSFSFDKVIVHVLDKAITFIFVILKNSLQSAISIDKDMG